MKTFVKAMMSRKVQVALIARRMRINKQSLITRRRSQD